MRLLPPLAVALILPLAVVACGDDDSGSAAPEPGHVRVVDNEFIPEEITVAAGETVTWDFEGAAVHNVTADDFESSENLKEGTHEVTFDDAGSFDYVCTLHPGMEGTVVVE